MFYNCCETEWGESSFEWSWGQHWALSHCTTRHQLHTPQKTAPRERKANDGPQHERPTLCFPRETDAQQPTLDHAELIHFSNGLAFKTILSNVLLFLSKMTFLFFICGTCLSMIFAIPCLFQVVIVCCSWKPCFAGKIIVLLFTAKKILFYMLLTMTFYH